MDIISDMGHGDASPNYYLGIPTGNPYLTCVLWHIVMIHNSDGFRLNRASKTFVGLLPIPQGRIQDFNLGGVNSRPEGPRAEVGFLGRGQLAPSPPAMGRKGLQRGLRSWGGHI